MNLYKIDVEYKKSYVEIGDEIDTEDYVRVKVLQIVKVDFVREVIYFYGVPIEELE